MSKLQPYTIYQPVQYDYVSQLPAGWQLLPNIAIFRERIERGFDNEELLSVTIGKGVIRQSENDIKKDSSNEDKSKYKLIKVGDIAYNRMRMWQGALGYSDYQGITSPAYVVLKPRMEINQRFFHYMFRTGFYTNYSKRFSYGIVDDQLSLRYVDFKRMYSIVPPLETQNAIVAYLDRKTQQIQEFIAKKERLIELLEEKRLRKIFELVAGKQGFTNYKESTLEHIGHIPSHWNVKYLNLICKVVLGKMLCNEDKGNYSYKKYLKSKNIGWENVIIDEVDYMWFSKTEVETYRIQKDDLLVSEGGEVGKTCIWMDELDECYIQNSVHKLKFNQDCNPIYYQYLFLVLGKGGYFKSIVNHVSIGHLTREKLVKVKCLVPPRNEQDIISEKIQNLNMEVSDLTYKAQKEIEKAKEYHESLITQVVTGQLKVPEKVNANLGQNAELGMVAKANGIYHSKH